DVRSSFENDNLATVTRVDIGTLDCDSLRLAESASELQFTISSTEDVLVLQASFEVLSENIFTDGKSRKVWMGTIVNTTAENITTYPRMFSMTWTDDCDVETFLLKIITPTSAGYTSIIKSVPCAAGGDKDICIIEVG
ncbi:unnamed protein product, partial [Choristocarpus tenellus]